MFELPFTRKLPDQPDSPPELTPREKADLADMEKYREMLISNDVTKRLRDPAYFIDVVSTLITDSKLVQYTLLDLITGTGDPTVSINILRDEISKAILARVEHDFGSRLL